MGMVQGRVANWDYRQEQLGGGIVVCTSRPDTFNEDSLLLASFARAERVDRACDLGTGCGMIPLLWCRREKPSHITAVDLSERACGLARLGAEKSGVQERIQVVCADLRDFWHSVRRRYDLVAMNPPYFRSGGGPPNADPEADRARRDGSASVEEVCHSAARLLNPGGRLCICFPAERLCDALCAMRAGHLEPKRLRPVAARPDQAARLFLIEGVLGGRPGLRTEPELVSCDAAGVRTQQMEKFLNGGIV